MNRWGGDSWGVPACAVALTQFCLLGPIIAVRLQSGPRDKQPNRRTAEHNPSEDGLSCLAAWLSGCLDVLGRAIDGTRTRDSRDHNPVLYQLSYDRRREIAVARRHEGI